MAVPYAKPVSEGKLNTTPPVIVEGKLYVYSGGTLLCFTLFLISSNEDTV